MIVLCLFYMKNGYVRLEMQVLIRVLNIFHGYFVQTKPFRNPVDHSLVRFIGIQSLMFLLSFRYACSSDLSAIGFDNAFQVI